MMIGASRNNHRSVLEFLLLESETLYMQMAQKYVDNAFETAVGEGNIQIMKCLVWKGKNKK